MQQETGDLKESEDGNIEFGTPTDDEEVTIPSHDRNREDPDFRILISVMSRLCQIHNEKTGYYLRSPYMGLARDSLVGSALR